MRTVAESWRTIARNGQLTLAAIVVATSLVSALAAPLVANHDPVRASPVDRLLHFGVDGHLLGTDQLGRDVYSRIVFGARLAWVVGIGVAAIAIVLGAGIGLVGGYSRRLAGRLAGRLVDVAMAFPPMLVALLAAAIVTPSTTTAIVVLGLVYTPLVARVVRSVVLNERELAYVSSARGIGNTETRTALRHVLPSTLQPLIVIGAIVLSRSIVVEASLSFLGVGTQPPEPSWGSMVVEAREFIRSELRLFVVPAVALSVLVLSINVIADDFGDRVGGGARREVRAR